MAVWLNHALDYFTQQMFSSALRLVPLFLAGWGLAWLFRRSSAAIRHNVWLTVIASAMLLPLLASIIPSWRVLPSVFPERQISGASETMVEPRRPTSVNSPSPVVNRTLSELEVSPMSGSVPDLSAPSQLQTRSRSHEVSMTPDFSMPAAIFFVWLSVAVILLVIPCLGFLKLRQAAREAEPPDAWIVKRFARVIQELQITRAVELRVQEEGGTPLTFGVLKPIILLPSAAKRWESSQLEMVLSHELAHVRRFDVLTQWLSAVACSVYWFHPFVWIASRNLRRECEASCDDVVLSCGYANSAYASVLLNESVRRTLKFSGPPAAIGMSASQRLQDRITCVLDKDALRNRASLVTLAMTMLLMTVLTCFAGAVTFANPTLPVRLSTQAGAANDEGQDPAGIPQEEVTVSRLVEFQANPVSVVLTAIIFQDEKPSPRAWVQIRDRNRRRTELKPEDVIQIADRFYTVKSLGTKTVLLQSKDGRFVWRLGTSISALERDERSPNVASRRPVKSTPGVKGMPAKDLKFLKDYPELHVLRLGMSEADLLTVINEYHLDFRKNKSGSEYSLPTDDGHVITVMFDVDKDWCRGIQRLRGTIVPSDDGAPEESQKRGVEKAQVRQIQRGDPLNVLIAGLESEDFSTRMRAVEFLGYRKDKRAVAPLVRALSESHLQESALHALKNLGPIAVDALPALFNALTAYPRKPATRWIAADAMSEVGKPAIPVAERGIRSDNLYERLWSHAVLAKIEGSESEHMLVLANAMLSADEQESLVATRALTMIGSMSEVVLPQIIKAVDLQTSPKTDLAVLLAQFGNGAKPAVPQLNQLLTHEDDMTRQRAAYALSRIGGQEIIPTLPNLISLLKAKRGFVREMAAVSIGTMGPAAKDAVPALLILAKDTEYAPRAAAITALGEIDPKDTGIQKALVEAMADSNGRVRSAVAPILAQYAEVDGAMIALFTKAADDNWGAVQDACHTFFRRLGPDQRKLIPEGFRETEDVFFNR